MIESGPISPIPTAPSLSGDPSPYSADATYENLFKELGNFDSKTGKTGMVFVSNFTGKFAKLTLGNGGSWCRSDGQIGRTFKLVRFYFNRAEPAVSWKKSSIEERCVTLDSLKLASPNNKKKDLRHCTVWA